ncbi:MAG: hypothetical protein COT15_03935 [Candidatus Diapherotrites archaeon CG08_land_8_20_14_0_20_34_12]|nr:MAG: hypothetical protein COT15_03935 [Candidatus Diapherotrites archaeon CG08_land_8_20_14_0_20_34_12]
MRPRKLPAVPRHKPKYVTPVVESEHLDFSVHSQRDFGPSIKVAHGQRGSIFLKGERHLRHADLVEMLIKAGVSVEEPFMMQKHNICIGGKYPKEPYLRKGVSMFMGKGIQFDLFLSSLRG